jgi:DNA (cytosine-5)-methyltransferase 1
LGTDFDCDGGLIPTAFGGNNTSGPIDIATACNAHGGPNGHLDFESETFIAHSLRADGFDASEDGTGRGTPLIPIAIQERAICENPAAGPDGIGVREDGLAYTLERRSVPQAVAFSCKDSSLDSGEISPTLRGMGHSKSHANAGGQVAVAIGFQSSQSGVREVDIHATLDSNNGSRRHNGVIQETSVIGGQGSAMQVRRLTPL